METAELTLRPTQEIIDLAKQVAEEENTSITQLFSAFILSRRKNQRKIPLGPLTRKATGLLNLPENTDYREEMENILEEKYRNEDIR